MGWEMVALQSGINVGSGFVGDDFDDFLPLGESRAIDKVLSKAVGQCRCSKGIQARPCLNSISTTCLNGSLHFQKLASIGYVHTTYPLLQRSPKSPIKAIVT